MSLTELDQLWNDHSRIPDECTERCEVIIKSLNDENEILSYLNLFQHLVIEHTFDFSRGKKISDWIKLNKKNIPPLVDFANRFSTIIDIVDSKLLLKEKLDTFSDADRMRILAVAAGSFAAKFNFDLAMEALKLSVQISENVPINQPAHRSLAINANNIACSLEEKNELSDLEKKLLIESAEVALNEWRKAGGWLETERAYYRLASANLKLNSFIDSIKHANQCLTICLDNSAPALEMFFAYEILAKIELRSGQKVRSHIKLKEYFDQLNEEDKVWCRASLQLFDNLYT